MSVVRGRQLSITKIIRGRGVEATGLGRTARGVRAQAVLHAPARPVATQELHDLEVASHACMQEGGAAGGATYLSKAGGSKT